METCTSFYFGSWMVFLFRTNGRLTKVTAERWRGRKVKR